MRRPSEAVVIGGGIAGCTVAYQLARRGLRVTVVEQGTIAGCASGRNMGLLLNQVDARVVKVMRHSLDIYLTLQRDGFAFDLRETPQLLLARDAVQLEAAGHRASALRTAGMKTHEITVAQLRAELPHLSDNLAGGHVVEGAWALTPERATRAFCDAGREQGVEVLTNTRAFSVVERGGRIEGVKTDRGTLPADCAVIATGPWLGELARAFPVRAARGCVLRSAPLDVVLPWIVQEMSWPDASELGRLGRAPTLAEVAAGSYSAGPRSLMLAQQPGRELLVGSSMAPSLKEASEGGELPAEVARHALELAPGLAAAGVDAAWSALRPMSPDGLPLAGRGGPDGLYVHGGHGSVGMMAAPALAAWLADLIVEGRQAPELTPYSPERFLSSGSSTPSA